MNPEKKYKVIGFMSGTSLDGADIAMCQFSKYDNKWKYRIIDAKTIKYPNSWKEKLKNAENFSGRDLFRLDHAYGRYIGSVIRSIIDSKKFKPTLIASHGHTVFHEPEISGSLQIGNGHDIFSATGIPVIADFRSMDVALGGQGAPLVPVGDLFLFEEYSYCLNLGGFSNISFTKDKIRIAFDICPVNTVLNHIAMSLGSEYDRDGTLGRKGEIIPGLLKALNRLDFYNTPPPRSMGKEFLLRKFYPVTEKYIDRPYDLQATLYEHISYQISLSVNQNPTDTILLTGGGAHNSFLLEKLQQKIKNKLFVPDKTLIDFKEALIFALLGLLRYRNEINCFSSVTGASKDSSTGILFDSLN